MPTPTSVARLSSLARHACALLPAGLYLHTLAPSYGMSDTVILLDAIERLHLDTHANSHNLAVLFGRLFAALPIGTPPLRANLASAAAGGLAAAVFYAAVFARFRSRATAALSTLCLAVSQSMWWHSTIAEAYAINALLTAAALYLLVRLDDTGDDRYLRGSFLLAGLAVFNHAQMGVLGLAGLVVLARRIREAGDARRAWRLAASCAGWGIAGLLPYLLTFAADARAWGLAEAAHRATGGDFKQVVTATGLSAALGELALLVFVQFPTPFLAAIAGGIFAAARSGRRGHAAWGGAVIALVTAAVFSFYRTWDRFAFLLPVFVVLAFAGARGVEAARRRLARDPRTAPTAAALLLGAASVAAPPWFYAQLAGWGRQPGIWQRLYDNRATANTHDGAGYRANPDKRAFRDVDEYLDLLFARLPPGAVYVDDDSRHYYAVRYEQLRYGRRPDVEVHLVNSWGFAGWGLEAPAFGELVRRAWSRDADLFLVSTEHPFAGLVAGLPALFRQYPLDAKRWIFKLVTRAEAVEIGKGMAGFAPNVHRVKVSRPDGSAAPAFAPADPVLVVAETDPCPVPLPVVFRWTPPRGAGFETVVMSARGQTATGTILRGDGARAPGDWGVGVAVGDRLLGEARFRVQAEAATRR